MHNRKNLDNNSQELTNQNFLVGRVYLTRINSLCTNADNLKVLGDSLCLVL